MEAKSTSPFLTLANVTGLIGWLGTALVFAALAVKFLRPELQKVWYGLALAGLACVLVYIAGQWRDIAHTLAGRQARLGALASAGVLIMLGILVGINYVTARHNKRWDLTASKQYTLSDQTRKILQNLKGPVRIKVFAREDDFDRFKNTLDEFEYSSNKVSVEYIDADKKPALAQQYQIQSYGTVVFEYGGRVERVTSDTEQELTNGLIKAVEGQQRKVYFTQGHGERDVTSSDRSGYKEIADALARDNFAVEKIVLAQQGQVPADASVVVIAGPKTDFFPTEVDALRNDARSGGKVLVLFDPPDKAESAPFTNLTAFLKDWNIDAGNNVVVDVSGIGRLIGTDASVPVAASYPSHPITDQFKLLTAYPFARSITAADGGGTRHPQTFIETSSRSWAETDVKALSTTGRVEFQQDRGDKQGPVSIGVAVSAPAEEVSPKPASQTSPTPAEARKPESRVVAIGDSDFAANAWLGVQGNRDLFLNAVNWLAQQENLIAIRPREAEDRRVTLTADQQRFIFLLSIFIIPGLVLGSGIYTWWRRR